MDMSGGSTDIHSGTVCMVRLLVSEPVSTLMVACGPAVSKVAVHRRPSRFRVSARPST